MGLDGSARVTRGNQDGFIGFRVEMQSGADEASKKQCNCLEFDIGITHNWGDQVLEERNCMGTAGCGELAEDICKISGRSRSTAADCSQNPIDAPERVWISISSHRSHKGAFRGAS